MSSSPLFDQLMETTRGRVMALLRRGESTVGELAEALELTGNAVRRHLVLLEREGLVEEAGRIREGVGKPARTYRLTPAAREAFPRPYGALLERLLEVLKSRTEPEELEAVLDEVGRSLARDQRRAGFPVEEALEGRVRAVGDVLAGLGGDAEIVRSNGDLVIRGYDCPLGRIVSAHPEACRVAETLLEELLEVAVREECERGEPSRCCFRVPLHPGPGGGGGGPKASGRSGEGAERD